MFAHGRGKVVLLHNNVLLARYPTHRLTGGEAVAPMKATFRKLLAEAKLTPRVPALDAKGDPHHGVEVVLFADGPARYAAVLFNSGYDGRIRALKSDPSKLACFDKPSRVSVRFDGTREVYNIRAGKHLGKAKVDTATLDPVAPLCYALLPYRVTGVDVQMASSAKRGEMIPVRCTVRTAGGGELARHVLRVDVLWPDGSLRTYYSRNLETSAGKAEMTIPLALNDAKGTWRVRVKDIATGATAEKNFQVE